MDEDGRLTTSKVRVGTTTWVAAVALLIAALMITGVSVQSLAEISPWANKNYAVLFFLVAAVLFIGLMLLRSYRNPRQEQDEADFSDKTINENTNLVKSKIGTHVLWK
jgi:membrane protein implicated in regulation of membrane protease activity